MRKKIVIVLSIIVTVSKNNQHDDTCGLSFIFRGSRHSHKQSGTEHVGKREGYSKILHTIPEADCTGKNELLMMSSLKLETCRVKDD